MAVTLTNEQYEKILNGLEKAIEELGDAQSFMETFDEDDVDSFGCICGADNDKNEETDCACIIDGTHKRLRNKSDAMKEATEAYEMFTGLKNKK
jgi:hypothetical protein